MLLILNQTAAQKIESQVVVAGIRHRKATKLDGASQFHDHFTETVDCLLMIFGDLPQHLARPLVAAQPCGGRISQVHRQGTMVEDDEPIQDVNGMD